MSLGARIAIGGAVGFGLGILVAVLTDLPLAPEIGVIIGIAVGWASGRN